MSRGGRRAPAVLFAWGPRMILAALVVSSPAASAPPPAKPAPSKPAGPAKPAPKPPPSPPVIPVTPLTILPSIARVKVTSHGKVVSVIEEVNLPRGDWKGDSLRFYVAFGSPGPRAIDAHLVGVGDGELEPEDDDAGEVLAIERVPHRPANAHPLLGRDAIAGIVVQVPASALTKAFARGGNMASLRIRSLVDATEPDASGASSVLVRLGASRGTPLTLGRIVATAAPSTPPLTRVEAKLCGPDADPQPLAVGLIPRPSSRDRNAIAPVLAVRHASDDLCLRWWTTPAL